MADGPARRWPALDVRFPLPPAGPDLADRLLVLLDDHHPTAIDNEGAGDADWRVFFASAAGRDAAQADIEAAFAGQGVAASAVEIDDGNWAARSQASLRAVQVGDLVVAPPWDAAFERCIIVQPSMGFGTGHHASTRLCLRALQRRPLAGAAVLDVGTGSGVLALAAALLGAGRVTAIDHDPDAIESARENLARNACGERVSLRLASLEAIGSDGPFEIVLANLTWAPLVQHAALLTRLTRPGGRLILCGFTRDEEASVREAYADLPVVDCGCEEDWVALSLHVPDR